MTANTNSLLEYERYDDRFRTFQNFSYLTIENKVVFFRTQPSDVFFANVSSKQNDALVFLFIKKINILAVQNA